MWKLINLKVPLDVLERIDGEAHRRKLTRTAYLVSCGDPANRTTSYMDDVAIPLPKPTVAALKKLIAAPPEVTDRVQVGPARPAYGSLLKQPKGKKP